MKKKRNIIIWSVILIYLILVLSFVSSKHKQILCDKLTINILNSAELQLVNADEIRELLFAKYGVLSSVALDSIDIVSLENKLNKQAAIKNALVYKIIHKNDSLINGELKIEIKQREPLLRFYNDSNETFYIDKEGIIIPAKQKSPAWVMIANGNIPFHPDSFLLANKLEVEIDSTLNQLFTITKFINKSDFWRSQIVQIYIDENKEFQLIPRVGGHRIYLGNADNFEIKFKKLYTVYFKGMKYLGWDQYKTIDLRFKNQVICQKK